MIQPRMFSKSFLTFAQCHSRPSIVRVPMWPWKVWCNFWTVLLWPNLGSSSSTSTNWIVCIFKPLTKRSRWFSSSSLLQSSLRMIKGTRAVCLTRMTRQGSNCRNFKEATSKWCSHVTESQQCLEARIAQSLMDYGRIGIHRLWWRGGRRLLSSNLTMARWSMKWWR